MTLVFTGVAHPGEDFFQRGEKPRERPKAPKEGDKRGGGKSDREKPRDGDKRGGDRKKP